MNSDLENLPPVLVVEIARQLPQGDIPAFALSSPIIAGSAQQALFEDPELVSLIRSAFWRQGQHFCELNVQCYLRDALATGIRPLSLCLYTACNFVETLQHLVPAHVNQLPANHGIHAFHAQLRNIVQTALPNRPPAGQIDWLVQHLDQLSYYAYAAVALINGPGIRELHFEVDLPDRSSLNPLYMVLVDINLNHATWQNTAFAPLKLLREITITCQTGGLTPDCLPYWCDLSVLPVLNKVDFCYGLPRFANVSQSLRVLYITKWACRTPHTGDLLPSNANNAQLHFDEHDEVLRMLRNVPNLEELGLDAIRVCNTLLAGLTYFRVPAPNQVVTVHDPPLGTVMRQHLPRLKTFIMRTRIYGAGQNQGQWLYRWFHDSLGTWTTYHQLEHINVDSWFMFKGRINAQTTTHPPITATQLPQRIKTLKIANLVEGYLRQFYVFLTHVWQEKQNGQLVHLTGITYSCLAGNANAQPFPPPGPGLTLAVMTSMLAQQGVTLIRDDNL